MLAHSLPLPLTIYYHEEGILLTLRHSNRVHYTALYLPSSKLRKIITPMDEQFPILERMHIESGTEEDTSNLVLARTFQAPHLRHLGLCPAALPIGSLLLTTTVGLVTLALGDIPTSTYFPPQPFTHPAFTHALAGDSSE
jgi:hypothetical protein